MFRANDKTSSSAPLQQSVQGDPLQGRQDPETPPPTQTGLSHRQGGASALLAPGRTAVLQTSSTSSKRPLSPQGEPSFDKRHAPDREEALHSLVAMHLARRRLCDSVQETGTQFDASQVVDVLLEQDDGQLVAKMQLPGHQVKLAWLSEEHESLAEAYRTACDVLPERNVELDQRLASRLPAATGVEHDHLALACRQELVHVEDQLTQALVQLAWLCPQDSPSAWTPNLSSPSDLARPQRVGWADAMVTLHYPYGVVATLEAEVGPRTEQAIRCLQLQHRQAILRAAIATDASRTAARQALDQVQAGLPVDVEIVGFDSSTGVVDLATGSERSSVQLDVRGSATAAAAGHATTAFLNCKSAHDTEIAIARAALANCRPKQSCFRMKDKIATMLRQGDADGNAYTAQSLYQALVGPLPADAAKKAKNFRVKNVALMGHFDIYLQSKGVNLSQALSRPAAFACHREGFVRSPRGPNNTLVTRATLSSERSIVNQLRNLAIELPIQDMIRKQEESTPDVAKWNWGLIDEFFDSQSGTPTYLAFLADTELACHAVRTLLDAPGEVYDQQKGRNKHGLHRLLCRTHPDKFPHSMEVDLPAMSSAAGHAGSTLDHSRRCAQVIGIFLVEHRIEYSVYRQDPARYRGQVEEALKNAVHANLLKMSLDLIEANIPPAPLQPLEQPAPHPVPEVTTTPMSVDSQPKKDFSVIYYRNVGRKEPNWSGAVTEVSAGRISEATFSHPHADLSQPSEQSLAVKTIHVNKQIGGQGHWSIVAECLPGPQLIKLDSVENGYRIYVGARRDSGYETESYDVSTPDGMTVKEVYDSMSRVAGGIGEWSDTEQGNCRGFVKGMLSDLGPKLSEPVVQGVRQRKAPQRYDPVTGL
jgi:hypothetical protein